MPRYFLALPLPDSVKEHLAVTAQMGDQPRAASPVNIVGRVLGDATAFRRVSAGTTVRLVAIVSG